MTDYNKLLIFLNEKKLWDSYKSNYSHPHKLSLTDFLKSKNGTEFFMLAFLWGKTPQGYNFWYELNIEWHLFRIKKDITMLVKFKIKDYA